MRKSWTIQTVLAVLLALGCTDVTGIDNPRVEFRTDRTSYALGEEGLITLTNRHQNPIAYPSNLCPLFIQRWLLEEWQDVPLPDSYVCRMNQPTLPPGQSFSRTFILPQPPFEAGGLYRFYTVVQDYQAGTGAVKFSNSFTITE